jgi:hypothetical protein
MKNEYQQKIISKTISIIESMLCDIIIMDMKKKSNTSSQIKLCILQITALCNAVCNENGQRTTDNDNGKNHTEVI